MILSNTSDFFGLDIGFSGARLVKLASKGSLKELEVYSFMMLDPKIVMSNSKVDLDQLYQSIKALVAKTNIKTKNVAVGIPSNKVFVSVVDVNKLPKEELAKSIKFQADSLIPTPLNESTMDWKLIGDSPVDINKVEIIISSVVNSYIEDRLNMLEAIGLNVVAFEPDTLALVRSLSDYTNSLPVLILDIGFLSSDIVLTLNNEPQLIRTIPTGYDAIIRSAVQTLNIDQNQAVQFVEKFGLNEQKVKGQIHNAIVSNIDLILTEIQKSINFFDSRYKGIALKKIIVTGHATSIPEFPLYLANKLQMSVEIGNSWRHIGYSPERQNELINISSQFAVACGLAERLAT